MSRFVIKTETDEHVQPVTFVRRSSKLLVFEQRPLSESFDRLASGVTCLLQRSSRHLNETGVHLFLVYPLRMSFVLWSASLLVIPKFAENVGGNQGSYR